MNDGMSKSQMALVSGLLSLFAVCIPCVGSMLYMVMVMVTLVLGVLAHSGAAETGEDTMPAKIGMAVSFLPGIFLAAMTILYVFFGVGFAILDNM